MVSVLGILMNRNGGAARPEESVYWMLIVTVFEFWPIDSKNHLSFAAAAES